MMITREMIEGFFMMLLGTIIVSLACIYYYLVFGEGRTLYGNS